MNKGYIIGWLFGLIIGCIVSVGFTHAFHLHGVASLTVGIACGFIFTTLGCLLGDRD